MKRDWKVGWLEASFRRKGTTGGVERRVTIWRFGRWEYEFMWWRSG